MSHPLTIVGLGESLFDVFPDRAILGGAPLNVAYHAHQLCSASGGRGIVASGAGTDELGRRLLEELRTRRLTAEFVQIDSEHSTGRVDITLRNGGRDLNVKRIVVDGSAQSELFVPLVNDGNDHHVEVDAG